MPYCMSFHPPGAAWNGLRGALRFFGTRGMFSSLIQRWHPHLHLSLLLENKIATR